MSLEIYDDAVAEYLGNIVCGKKSIIPTLI